MTDRTYKIRLDDDEVEINPPSPADVVRQAIKGRPGSGTALVVSGAPLGSP